MASSGLPGFTWAFQGQAVGGALRCSPGSTLCLPPDCGPHSDCVEGWSFVPTWQRCWDVPPGA